MSTAKSTKRSFTLARFTVGLGAIVLTPALALPGCNEAAEGDRCNPLRSSDECGGGLVCSGYPIGLAASHPIAFCPENYCCPATVTASDSPYCQPGCNGGAASICFADGGDTAACDFVACVDASSPESCSVDAAVTSASTDAGSDAAEASSSD